ncbi:MAG: hypothetical protein AAGG02_03860 [Cyanobacteria bacterium P01_H01_bin.15]
MLEKWAWEQACIGNPIDLSSNISGFYQELLTRPATDLTSSDWNFLEQRYSIQQPNLEYYTENPDADDVLSQLSTIEDVLGREKYALADLLRSRYMLNGKYILSPTFVETILLDEPFKNALPNKLLIKGFTFVDLNQLPRAEMGDTDLLSRDDAEDIDLSSSQIRQELRFEDCLFFGRLMLQKSTVFNSVSLKDSIFRKTIDFENVRISGSLLGTNLQFVLNGSFLDKFRTEETQSLTLLNIRSAQINNDVELTKILPPTLFSESFAKGQVDSAPQNTPEPQKIFELTVLDLKTAQIGGALDLDSSDFSTDKLCNQKGIGTCRGKVNLLALRTGDAVKLNHVTRFDVLDMANITIKSLILNMSYRGKSQNCLVHGHCQNFSPFQDFSQREIDLSDANVELASLHLHADKRQTPTSPAAGTDAKEMADPPDAPPSVPQIPSLTTLSGCSIVLNGMVYQNINKHGLDLIKHCIEREFSSIGDNPLSSFFNQAIPYLTEILIKKEAPDIERENRARSSRYKALLQPLKQASVAAHSNGLFHLERDFNFTQKKVEHSIAWLDGHGFEWIFLTFQGMLYGYGYRRAYALFWGLAFWFVGVILAARELRYRLREELLTAAKLVHWELVDEVGLDSKPPKRLFADLRSYLDKAQRILFYGYFKGATSQNSENDHGRVFLYLPRDSRLQIACDSYVEVDFSEHPAINDISETNLIETGAETKLTELVAACEARGSEVRKIGLVDNLLPQSGSWAIYFSQIIREESSNDNDECQIQKIYSLSASKWLDFSCEKFFRPEYLKYLPQNKLEQSIWINSAVFVTDLMLPYIDLASEFSSLLSSTSSSGIKFYFIFLRFFSTLIFTILLPVLFLTLL